MFGYIRPQKPEMLVREFEQYRGVYCSLCKELGKNYGFVSRLSLSYDCTFYAVFLMSLSGECPSFSKGRCVVNPTKACNYCGGRKELQLAAALSVIMVYYKAKDDLADAGFTKKARALFLLPFASHARKKAAKEHPALEEAVCACMKAQSEAEEQKSPGLDACAQPTAQMLESAFVYGASCICGQEDSESPLLRVTAQLGYHLGRWVYFIDAADDLPKDINSEDFNPFAVKFEIKSPAEETMMQNIREYANGTLNQCAAQMSSALELLELSAFASIVRNIINLGLPEMQREILFSKEKKNVRSL